GGLVSPGKAYARTGHRTHLELRKMIVTRVDHVHVALDQLDRAGGRPACVGREVHRVEIHEPGVLDVGGEIRGEHVRHAAVVAVDGVRGRVAQVAPGGGGEVPAGRGRVVGEVRGRRRAGRPGRLEDVRVREWALVAGVVHGGDREVADDAVREGGD